MLEVYYFAAARAAAGTSHETVEPAATLGELCRRLSEQAAPVDTGLSLAEVLERSSFLLDGRGVGDLATAAGEPLAGVSRVDVLPPFAGG